MLYFVSVVLFSKVNYFDKLKLHNLIAFLFDTLDIKSKVDIKLIYGQMLDVLVTKTLDGIQCC